MRKLVLLCVIFIGLTLNSAAQSIQITYLSDPVANGTGNGVAGSQSLSNGVSEALIGIKIVATGTPNLKELNFMSTSTSDPNDIFDQTSRKVVQVNGPNYATATVLNTYNGGNINTTTFGSFKGYKASNINLAMTNGGTYYFFLVLTTNYSQNAIPATIQFSVEPSLVQFNNAATANVTTSATTVYNINTEIYWRGDQDDNWDNASNWYNASGNNINRVPKSSDIVYIGGLTYTNQKKNPIVKTTSPTVYQIVFGLNVAGDNTRSLSVRDGQTLTVTSSITQLHNGAGTVAASSVFTTLYGRNSSDATPGSTGVITCAAINVGDATSPPGFSGRTAVTTIQSNVPVLNVTGAITMQSVSVSIFGFGWSQNNALFNVVNGTLNADGQLTTTNTNVGTGASASFTVSPTASTTVNVTLSNASPVNITNTTYGSVNFYATTTGSSNVNYDGTTQSVYTGSQYGNLIFSGSGTKTPGSGTLTVNGTFSTTASTTPTVDFTTNNAIMTVGSTLTNVSGATVKQGSGAFTITGQLSNAGTFTGGSGALNANGSTNLTGGTFTTGSGLFSTTSLDNATGTFQQGSGNVTLTQGLRLFSGTMNYSAGTVGVGTGVAITGGTMNAGAGAFTIGNGLSIGPGTLNCGASPGTLGVTGPFSNGSTGTFSAGTGTTTFKGAYTNTGTFTYGAGTIIFNNGTTAQALADNSTNGTTFNKVTFSGTGAKTMSGTGQFYVASTGVLTMGTSAALTAGGVLTLKSDANGSAAVDVMPSGASIGGSVHVQRFLTGGSISTNRGYRLLSSPVNQTSATISNANTFNLAYLNQHTFNSVSYAGAFTGGAYSTDALAQAAGFSAKSATPTLYLYKESITASNTTALSGKHVAIIKVTATDVATSNTADNTATISNLTIPIGNGFLMYFVGPSTRTSGSASGSNPTAGPPQDATMTDNGFINQGPFTVKLWYTPTGGAGTLSNTQSLAVAARGFNMVGNPYPSTLNLSQLYTDNSASIDVIYMLSQKAGGTSQNYVAYSTNGSSSPAINGFAVSGAGFIVHVKTATSTTSTLSFNENQKAPTQQVTGSSLIMSAPKADVLVVDGKLGQSSLSAAQQRQMAIPVQTNEQPITGLYMKMEKDSNVFSYCGIYYKKEYAAKYEDGDAPYLSGLSSPVVMASLTSDGVNTAINHLPDYHNGSRVKLNVSASVTGIYNLKLEGVRNIDTLYDIYLMDHFKKDSLDIRRYGTYAFNLVSTDTTTFGANRFELVIRRRPLPEYLLTDFAGTKVTEGVNVTWKTVNESNYTGFTLEKLNVTTNQYDPLYDKQSDGSNSYSYIDHAPSSGNNTYRLKQNDIDNRISYSQPVTIFYDKNAAKGLFSVFPNPTAEVINVSIPATQKSVTYRFRLYDSSGNLLIQQSSNTSNWTQNVGNLKTGAYIVEVLKSDGVSLGKGKFIKN